MLSLDKPTYIMALKNLIPSKPVKKLNANTERNIMRIISGKFKGRVLTSLSGINPELRLRPTSERAREAIFNILMHNSFTTLNGARILDLFAGTGALGLEALSRGAAHAIFIENNPEPRAIIRENIEKLGLTGQTNIYRRDASKLGVNRAAPFDILFIDPPYDSDLLVPTLECLRTEKWISPSSLIITEFPASSPPSLDKTWTIVSQKKYGKSAIVFLQLQDD